MIASAPDFEVCGICASSAAIMRTVRSTTVNIDAEKSAAAEGGAAQPRRALVGCCLITSRVPGLHLQRSFASGAPLTMGHHV
jgi:hypothetical protein